MPLFGSKSVYELEKNKDVNGLIRTLKEDYQREQAVEALGRLGDRKAVKPLIKLLKNENSQSIRKKICESLGKLQDTRAIETLIETLQKENSVSSGAAGRALGSLRDDRAIKPLIQGLKLSAVRNDAHDALLNYGSKVVEPLLPLLQDPDDVVRMNAVDILGRSGDQRAIPACLPLLSDPSAHISAAKALDRLNWTPNTDEEKARYWIAKYDFEKVRELGLPALEPLITTLGFESQRVHTSAAHILGEIGGQTEDPELRQHIIKNLIPCLDDTDTWLQSAAREALLELGYEAEDIADRIHFWISSPLTNTEKMSRILGIGSAAVEPLLDLLKESNSENSDFIICKLLGKLGEIRAVEPLLDALKLRPAHSCYMMLDALVEIGDSRAIEPLKTLMRIQTDKASRITDALKKLPEVDEKYQTEENQKPLTILPLEDAVLYPYAAFAFSVSNSDVIRLLDGAMQNETPIGIVAVRDPDQDDLDGVYLVGTEARVYQGALHKHDASVQVIVSGIARFQIIEFVEETPYLRANVKSIPESVEESPELEALTHQVKTEFFRKAHYILTLPDELATYIENLNEPTEVAYLIASFLSMEVDTAQQFLEANSVMVKLRSLKAKLAEIDD